MTRWFLDHLPYTLATDHDSPHLLFADYCSPRAEVLGLDRRLHPGLSLHLPADVDQQARVWWGRALHCPQEVLLKSEQILWRPSWDFSVNNHETLKFCKPYFSVWGSLSSWAVSYTVLRAFHTLFLVHTMTLWGRCCYYISQMRKLSSEKLRTCWRSHRTRVKNSCVSDAKA